MSRIFPANRVAMSAVLVATLALIVVQRPASAEVKLPAVIDSHMVLQRDMPAPIWGWADAGEKVSVTFAGQTKTATAGDDGRWMVKLDPLAASSEPREMTVAASNTIKLADVLVGEVWVCSGQSNMAWTVSRSDDADIEALSADYPRIRLFTTARVASEQPQDDTQADWQVCSPQTVPDFSAVGYYFGRQLHRVLDVPIGLINTSWGGTPAEAWTRRGAMDAEPKLALLLERWDRSVADFDPEKAKQQHEKAMAEWKTKAAEARKAGKQPPRQPRYNDPRLSQHRPAVLYNGKVAPIIPFAIRGAIWYQGESNASRAYQYRTVFPTMINNWREDWKQGDFPFYWVQLANFQQVRDQPVEHDAWAELREAQSMTLSLPNTGEAVIIDIGQANDIHPTNKQDVGRRLARLALANDYGIDLVARSPHFKSMQIKGDKAVLTFDHVGGGLKVYDREPIKGFQIAGADKQWHWAEAKITGKDQVTVRSDAVKEPVAVRYGWAINPVANVYNSAGLPMSPFRTDDWPGMTVDNH